MDSIISALDGFNSMYWNVAAGFLVIAGLYFGVLTRFVQLRKIPDMFRAVSEKPDIQQEPAAGATSSEVAPAHSISAFKAFTISAASRVGTGNVAGVAIAITVGGPGAVFWMWVIAILGGATSFIESTLAQLWKVRNPDGSYRGGPAYYMTRGLGWRWLAVIFAVAITLTFGFFYNSIQSNSIRDALGGSLDTDTTTFRWIIAIVLTALTASIIFGGLQRIADFTAKCVPVMAGLYVIIGLIVIILNIGEVPRVIGDIVGHALGFKEIAGATLGQAFIMGLRRGLFSNEAGEGSVPNAAATATVSHPVKQGLVQTLGVYFDTLLVCSITAFIILLDNPVYGDDDVQGVTLTQTALGNEVGAWGIHAVTVLIFFLAFSSIIGNTYVAQTNIEFFTDSPKVLNGYRIVVLFFVFLGAIVPLELVWGLGDLMAATMVFINLIAIVPLGGVACNLLRNYVKQRRQGLDPVFHKDMMPGIRHADCWDGSDPITWRDGKVVTSVEETK